MMKSIVLTCCLIIVPYLLTSLIDCDEIPPLNKKIIDFVESNIKKKVGSGECWDLAAEALNLVQANWDGDLNFGKKIDYMHECVYPGDIIQFEKVKVKHNDGKNKYEESMPHHTAIIYKVKGTGDFVLAHQNTGYTGKKVGTSTLLLSDIKSGKFSIYRPER